MTGIIEDTAARFFGLNDDDIALVNKELPDLDELIANFQAHKVQIDRVLGLLKVVQKVIAKERSLK